MGANHIISGDNKRGFMTRLGRDVSGNTLAIMTMALIPLAGMVGGAVDISRMYIVKTRLQHACDAGALAGRKMMSSGVWSFNNYASRTSANNFFNANFPSGSYGATNVTKEFTENAGKVSGAASATLPMTLMRIFGRTTETLTVACDAEMRLPNTDVMFVLDTTGSMDQDDGTGTKKIDGLRFAVKCFYQIVARLDVADADCEGPEPSGGTGNQVQIRFGFMPYSVNVNVGKLLPTSFFADSWQYQTREAIMRTESTPVVTIGDWVNGSPVVTSENTPLASSTAWAAVRDYAKSWGVACAANADDPLTPDGPEGAPYNVSESVSGNTRTTTWATQMPAKRQYKYQVTEKNSRCYVERRINYGTMTRTYSRTDNRTSTTTYETRQVFDKWRYKQLPVDISKLKNGTTWNNSFVWPVASNGTDKTINWAGCIEERKTDRTTDYDPIPTTATDLDFNSVPTTNADTQWKPYLPDVIYTRRNGTRNWNRDTSE
ncbi:MAG: pilus assembly protein TadG, partial [Sphingomonadales bacterium]